MRICLINPPSPYLENQAAYPPMGLLYIAAKCEELGHDVHIHDMTVTRKDVPRDEIDLYGITCVTPNVPVVSRIAGMLPGDVPLMVGGPHPSAMPISIHQEIPRVDLVVVGECESTLEQITTDVERGYPQSHYLCGIPCVGVIPSPARYLVDEHRYRPGGEEMAVVHTSRGCIYECAFCSKIQGIHSIRLFPPERILRELREVKRNGFSRFMFADDNSAFTFSKPYAGDLLKGIREIGMTWRINQDTRHATMDRFRQYADAGCTDISFGIESGSQRMLDAMNKKIPLATNYNAVEHAHAAGLRVRAYFIVNFPGETEETVRETLLFAEETQPDSWLLSAFAPLPGSPVWNRPKKYGITSISRNWEDFYLVGKNGGFSPCFTTDELTHERQIELHAMMREGLKGALG